MSGMTRSIPNISSSGNIRPQSMTTMSSPYSNTYMFLPISPTPPSGMIRRVGLGGGMKLGFSVLRCGVWSGYGEVGGGQALLEGALDGIRRHDRDRRRHDGHGLAIAI